VPKNPRIISSQIASVNPATMPPHGNALTTSDASVPPTSLNDDVQSVDEIRCMVCPFTRNVNADAGASPATIVPG